MIMVKDLSRLGRNHIEVNKYIEDIFPSLNARVFSINDDKTVEIQFKFKNHHYEDALRYLKMQDNVI